MIARIDDLSDHEIYSDDEGEERRREKEVTSEKELEFARVFRVVHDIQKEALLECRESLFYLDAEEEVRINPLEEVLANVMNRVSNIYIIWVLY
jgi:hypothetical protein